MQKKVSPSFVAFLILSTLVPWAAQANTFVINEARDRVDYGASGEGAAPEVTPDGICDVDLSTPGLQCTFSEAIKEANANPGLDTIQFPTMTIEAAFSWYIPQSGTGAYRDNSYWVFTGPTQLVPVNPTDRLTLIGLRENPAGKYLLSINAGNSADSDPASSTVLFRNVDIQEQRKITPVVVWPNSIFNFENGSIHDNHEIGISGGGITADHASVNISNSKIYNNDLWSGDGGAIFAHGGALNLYNVSLFNNQVLRTGGAIAVWGTPVTASNVTIAENHSSDICGGIDLNYNRSDYYGGLAPTQFNNVTIVNNVSNYGIGHNVCIQNESSTPQVVDLKNSIISSRESSGGTSCFGYFTNVDNSIENTTGCFAPTSQRLTRSGVDINLSSLNLVDGTITPQSGSFAINAGDNRSCLSEDERKIIRENSDTNPCDAGAIEVAYTPPPPPPPPASTPPPSPPPPPPPAKGVRPGLLKTIMPFFFGK